METYRVRCCIGPNGKLSLDLPTNIANMEVEVVVVIQPLARLPEQKKAAPTLEEIRQKHENAYAPWTLEEEQQLMELHAQGQKPAEIAKILGRHTGAVRSRINRIMLRQLNDMHLDLGEDGKGE